MNGLTQKTTAAILALQKWSDLPDKPKERLAISELEVLRIVDAALVEAAQPHRDESENCKRIVNETNERATARVQEATAALADKQNEVIGLRAELAESRAKVIDAGNRIGEQQAAIEEFKNAKAELESLSLQPDGA